VKVISCIVLLFALVSVAAAADATGKWTGTFAPTGTDGQAGSPVGAFVVLKQTGTTITGSGGPDESEQWPLQNGKIAGNKVTGQVTAPDGAVYALAVTMDGDTMTGEVTVTQDGQSQKGKIEMKRVK
jgi:hypothetical protein